MDADVAAAAALFADRTRAAIVAALLDGRALTAGELARAAGVSAATVSSHLAKLSSAGLIAGEAQGRHRYYRLVDERVGRAFESLAALAPAQQIRTLRESRIAADLRWARTCYDHLAGTVAVSICAALLERDAITAGDGTYGLGPAADVYFPDLGVDVESCRRAHRSTLHPCLDWSERRHHLAGAVGAALLAAMIDRDWARPRPSSRAVAITPKGNDALGSILGITATASPATV